jgi:hypothetical protein
MSRMEQLELDRYRNLMSPPSVYEDGFTWKTAVGALFLGFVMMPASMYLALFAGSGAHIGAAARWVTIIIFAEIARRSLKDLKMQEVYILFYMAGLTLASPFQGLLWNQYYVQSEYARAMGVAQDIPAWFAPPAEAIDAAGRTFFTRAWLAPILLSSFGVIIGKIDHYGLGYVLYRITNDVEKLPFPFAPVDASGIMALTENKENKERWRWRWFSIGGMMGLLFGAVYIGVPAVTGAILAKPIRLIPIPWIDFTEQVSRFFPATPLNLTFDIGAFLLGTVMPFWAVVGGAIGLVMTFILNPILHSKGILTSWTSQMGFIDTAYSNSVDFYLSFSVGLTIAVTLISFWKIFETLIQKRRERRNFKPGDTPIAIEMSAWRRFVTNNVTRGDFSVFISMGIYLATSAFWITLSCFLVPGFPWPFFVFYAVIYTPLISYASAKLEGLCGQSISIPLIREATYILSGYRGVRIWFAPAPIPNYGFAAKEFRVMELCGTKIISQIKTQAVVIPIIIIASIIFSQVLWQMAPIPSEAYPFAQQMWDLQAKTASLTYSSTMEGGSLFMEAWKWQWFGAGIASGIGSFILLSVFSLPTLVIFGLVRGLGESFPGILVMQIAGAIVGRYYIRRRMGDQWLKYAPVLMAGFSCGMGLVAMVAVAFTILTKMMAPLLF